MSKQLFNQSVKIEKRLYPSVPEQTRQVSHQGKRPKVYQKLIPTVDDRLLEVLSRANNPNDPIELRDLWIGRIEYELGSNCLRPNLAEKWRTSSVHRTVESSEVLQSRATVRFIKELFNWFFRDDLYGALKSENHIILSSGSVNEEMWGLPNVIKECIRYALDRDWYGYSDPRGRIPTREAIAAFENLRIDGRPYDTSNVALTMGGTFAISALVDWIFLQCPRTAFPALCAIPNYPPLVESVARRHNIQLIPTESVGGITSLATVIETLTPQTPLVLLQTTTNPTGSVVDESELERLVNTASPSTMILLDECHDWLGLNSLRSGCRAARNVIRVSSLSKRWSIPGLKIGWILADTDFISDYYEYASTSFGGPPSFFSTAVEVLVRMERWLLSGIEEPRTAELNEFEPSYALSLKSLTQAFASYRSENFTRERALIESRDAAVSAFMDAKVDVLVPDYSINMTATFPGWNDSYLCFREILRDSGVSLYPGILTFCYSGAIMRITTANNWQDLVTAASRIAEQIAKRA